MSSFILCLFYVERPMWRCQGLGPSWPLNRWQMLSIKPSFPGMEEKMSKGERLNKLKTKPALIKKKSTMYKISIEPDPPDGSYITSDTMDRQRGRGLRSKEKTYRTSLDTRHWRRERLILVIPQFCTVYDVYGMEKFKVTGPVCSSLHVWPFTFCTPNQVNKT